MPIVVDDVVQDSKALRATVETHKEELAAKGYGESKVKNLDNSIDNLLKKDAAQKTAQTDLLQRTSGQDTAMNAAFKMITKIQNAAKAAYGRDQVKLKLFKVGDEKPKTVGKMLTTLEYFTGIIGKYSTDLISNGLLQDDISNLSTIYANVVAADAAQENAKKLRNASTETRDAAAEDLKQELFKLRKFAQAAFDGNKALLEEFKPIKRGRGKAAPAPPSPTPTQTTAQK